jgi:4-amino-4-deoxy-L-arabinose transferase-like glycosyltransferase
VIFLIGLLIWKKIRCGDEWKPRDQVYMFILLTSAMLIKGPIVYAFLLPGIALFQLCRGRARPTGAPKVNSGSAWPGLWPWVASLAIFLAWVFGGIRFQPGFYEEVVMREFLGRFGETIHRPQPLFFYLPHLLHKFAPWSVLMIAIALFNLRSRNWRLGSTFRDVAPETFWLLYWSIGGLIVMSLIPSKRVDRIFPVIPPLCLLLAAQVAPRNCSHGPAGHSLRSSKSDETAHGAVATQNPPTHLYRWSALAVAFAILFTGGYTIFKVITGYRDHRNALAVFGKNIRDEAEVRHWRYEVVSAKEEGLLLYLQKTHFIEPQHAVIEWNNGNLDALVTSTEKAKTLMPKLRGAVLSESKAVQPLNYILITR